MSSVNLNLLPEHWRPQTSRRNGRKSVPRHRKALETRNYLLRRLEQLRTMLLNGEEAIIVLNNRIKKLGQVGGEQELQQAVCTCVTARAGRAAMMLIYELFAHRHAPISGRTDMARDKARDAARDAADFCAYWYGDTIRSLASQKVQQIRRLVVETIKQAGETSWSHQTTTVQNTTTIHDVSAPLAAKIKVVTKIVEIISM